MSLPEGILPLTPLAFQVWDAVGWAGQILFTLRVLHQWYFSEKTGRSHVTAAYWWFSLLATPLLLVYVLHRQDPVFIVGFLVNGFLYVRNLVLLGRGEETRRRASPWMPVIAGLAVFAVVTFLSLSYKRIVSFDFPWPWLALGFTGQAIWSSRFVVQWYVSEKQGRSVLPPAFFWISLAGAVLLFAWAVYRRDWVMMAAFAFNPIPYVRNLVLLRRQRTQDR